MTPREEIIGAALAHARDAVALWHSQEDDLDTNVCFAYSMSRLRDDLWRLDQREEAGT